MSSSNLAPPIDPTLLLRRLEELRPVSTMSRSATLLLLITVLVSYGQSAAWVMAVVVLSFAWVSFNLWREVTGRVSRKVPAAFYLAAVPMMLIVVHGSAHGGLLVPLVIHPLTVITLLYSLRMGFAAAAAGSAGLMLSFQPLGFSAQLLLPALGLLVVPFMAQLASRPIAALRRRVELASELERDLDPRRGLQAVGLVVVDRLRQATGAQRVILFHRDAELPTVLVADQDDSAYEASPALSARLLPVLAQLPAMAVALNTEATPGSALSSQAPLATRQAMELPMRQMASLLDAQALQLVPDAPGDPRSGWLLVAYGPSVASTGSAMLAREGDGEAWHLSALAAFAAEMRRMLQQASYVDTLQAEIAAHERSRIGRDLHDSAVQPYLGLKFAIDVVAQRCTADNPISAHIQELRQFCETELHELRETVSVLRSGDVRGDNALIPALRRQAQRFSSLFGIETHLSLPDEAVASRALSGAVLHMVNEALNNVRRHTTAKQVWVSLVFPPGMLELVIRDDAGQRNGLPAPHFEPRSLIERARELGGTLSLRRHQGLDTEVLIHIPVASR